MKKIFFILITLACSLSVNAQVMKVMKNGEVVAVFKSSQMDAVVFEGPITATTGSAMRTGDIEVNWVQLWAGGPRFAEYNVGATSETEYGGYYCWGGSIDKDPKWGFFGTYGVNLTDNYDTATNLWGTDWRMPTTAEYNALIKNCNIEWTDNYKESGLKGLIFTGEGDYVSNSVFFPAAGRWVGDGNFDGREQYGRYWSASSSVNSNASFMDIIKTRAYMSGDYRDRTASVRAVLAE